MPPSSQRRPSPSRRRVACGQVDQELGAAEGVEEDAAAVALVEVEEDGVGLAVVVPEAGGEVLVGAHVLPGCREHNREAKAGLLPPPAHRAGSRTRASAPGLRHRHVPPR